MTSITWLRKFNCDVLVIDVIGTGWLQKCLPQDCHVETLDIRNRKPLLLDLGFLFLLCRSLVFSSRKGGGHIGYAWLSALLKRLTPRLIISCADNNALLAKYAEDNPEVPVVLIQNALRDTQGSMTPGQNLPIYLAFGEIEREIFHTVGIRCRQYQPIGSVKLGLALVEEKDKPHQAFDLAFISQYRPSMFERSSAPLESWMEANQKYLFQLCCRYAQARTLTLAVITKSRESQAQLAEQEYYKRLASGLPLHFVGADKAKRELDSYLAGLASDLVIHPASTLGFELLATGKKVVLGATVNPNLIQAWGIKHYVDALPDSVKLKAGGSDADFFQHCDTLRAMPDARYRELTRTAAQSLVSMPADGYPHEKVKALISGWLRP
jgi:surface carbohydrate biosynthesis protein